MARLKLRMPAEWEPHRATWLAWPHERTDWPGKFAPIPWLYGEIVRHLARAELVRIFVQDEAAERGAIAILRKCHADLAAVEFVRQPTNRSWTRDYCPLFVKDARDQIAATHWRFNAWAKYRDWAKDAKVPERAARALGLRLIQVHANGHDLVLEGGAIDVNGRGRTRGIGAHTRSAAARARVARAAQAEKHVHRCAAADGPSGNGPSAYLLQPGRRRHRPPEQFGSQPAEHSHPYRARTRDSTGVRRCTGTCADLRRLFTD